MVIFKIFTNCTLLVYINKIYLRVLTLYYATLLTSLTSSKLFHRFLGLSM